MSRAREADTAPPTSVQNMERGRSGDFPRRNTRAPTVCPFAVAIALGMRRGEALGLRWHDIDLVNGTMTMAMQLQRVGGKLRHDETKTDDSTRVVPFPPALRASTMATSSPASGATVGSRRPVDRFGSGVHYAQGHTD
jgi:hypothetical protein